MQETSAKKQLGLHDAARQFDRGLSDAIDGVMSSINSSTLSGQLLASSRFRPRYIFSTTSVLFKRVEQEVVPVSDAREKAYSFC